MLNERLPYVRPALTQLQFISDNKVSMMAGCKSTGAQSGPAVPDCNGGDPTAGTCVSPIS